MQKNEFFNFNPISLIESFLVDAKKKGGVFCAVRDSKIGFLAGSKRLKTDYGEFIPAHFLLLLPNISNKLRLFGGASYCKF